MFNSYVFCLKYPCYVYNIIVSTTTMICIIFCVSNITWRSGVYLTTEVNTKVIKVESQHWHEVQHSVFVMPYVGYLVVNSLSNESYTPIEQLLGGSFLTDGPSSHVRVAEIDTDELDRPTFKLEFEAESDVDALRLLCHLGLEAWMEADKDPSDLEFVAAHIAYLPELQPTGDDISEPDYLADRLTLVRMDDEGEMQLLQPHQIFYDAQGSYNVEELHHQHDEDTP